MSFIKGTKVLLRNIQKEDEESLTLAANHPQSWQWLRRPYPNPYTTKDAIEWINKNLENNKLSQTEWKSFGICLPENEKEIVGGIGIHGEKDNCMSRTIEMGYWLSPKYWGKGMATEAVELMTLYTFNEFTKIRGHAIERIEGFVFLENIASQRVLEKCGFHCEALLRKKFFKHGTIHDGKLYSKIRE